MDQNNNKIGPNVTFTLLMLQTLRSCEIENEDPIEMVPLVIERIKIGEIKGCEGANPKLLNNFENGWDRAIEKYGADVAPSKMKAFLIKTLIECSEGLTEESLTQMLDLAWGTATLFVRGMHLTKDEEGNYHHED